MGITGEMTARPGEGYMGRQRYGVLNHVCVYTEYLIGLGAGRKEAWELS